MPEDTSLSCGVPTPQDQEGSWTISRPRHHHHSTHSFPEALTRLPFFQSHQCTPLTLGNECVQGVASLLRRLPAYDSMQVGGTRQRQRTHPNLSDGLESQLPIQSLRGWIIDGGVKIHGLDMGKLLRNCIESAIKQFGGCRGEKGVGGGGGAGEGGGTMTRPQVHHNIRSATTTTTRKPTNSLTTIRRQTPHQYDICKEGGFPSREHMNQEFVLCVEALTPTHEGVIIFWRRVW